MPGSARSRPSKKSPARRVARGKPPVLDSGEDVRAGVRYLVRTCPDLKRAHRTVGDPPLRRHPAGFAGLARIVVGQQLSMASATAIFSRVEARFAPLDPRVLLAARDEELVSTGLSRPKIKTLRALSRAVAEGALDLAALEAASDEDVHAELTAVSGIGPWTADIYLMFCLGRADSWAAGDLALQIATQHALRLDEKPDARQLAAIAERWRPWRSVAAAMLWAYYARLRAGETAALQEATSKRGAKS